MYSVEIEMPLFRGVDDPDFEPVPEWVPMYDVPQRETEQAELQEARKIAKLFRDRYYHGVRITKSRLGGGQEIVA